MLIPLNAIIVTINFIVSYLLILTLLLGLLYLLDLWLLLSSLKVVS